MMMGRHPLAERLVVGLELGKWPLGRFRDCYPNEACDKIVVLTRNGGGNRAEYQEVFDNLRKHPNYLSDHDDPFDSTYAEIEFSVPKDLSEVLAGAKEMGLGYKPFHERFHDLMGRMQSGNKDPLADAAMKNAEPLMNQLKKILGA